MGHSFDDYLLRRTDLVDESCPHCNDNPRERNSSLERQNSIKEFLGILLTSKIHKRVRVFPESLEGIRGKQPDVVYVEELPTLAQKFLADHVQESCLTGSSLPVQYNELVRSFFNDMFQEVLDEDILLRILDPNQAFETKYINYTAATKSGRELSGIIAAETPNSITLRNAGGTDETILRGDIKELTSSRLSLMPEGFENTLKPQDMADLIAFIRSR